MKCSKPLLRCCSFFLAVVCCSILLLTSLPTKAHAEENLSTNYIGGALVCGYDSNGNYFDYPIFYDTDIYSTSYSNGNSHFFNIYKEALYIEDTIYERNECYLYLSCSDDNVEFLVTVSYSELTRTELKHTSVNFPLGNEAMLYLLDTLIERTYSHNGLHILFNYSVDVRTSIPSSSVCEFVYEGAVSSNSITTINGNSVSVIDNILDRSSLVDNPTLWLKNAVSGFLDFEIMPDLSLKDILYIVLALGLLIAILKIWLGG